MKMRSCLALVLTLALFLFTPGTLLAKDIVVLAQFPLSGPHGSLDEVGWGFTDVMNWFNEEAGGVGGRKVKWFMEDMRYSPTVEVANFHKYCSEYGPDELLMATGYITGALKPLINRGEKVSEGGVVRFGAPLPLRAVRDEGSIQWVKGF
ncbi:MAG: ABC transporter substrate-binding protein [Deltaproteobacteria bacterium]|nr:ABC transporter substrate-binding protein [Deltaproteobacteria bacterium]MBW1951012.1 ABC transporter substrate-binding protein [Deltaproteobacteria bacterium]